MTIALTQYIFCRSRQEPSIGVIKSEFCILENFQKFLEKKTLYYLEVSPPALPSLNLSDKNLPSLDLSDKNLPSTSPRNKEPNMKNAECQADQTEFYKVQTSKNFPQSNDNDESERDLTGEIYVNRLSKQKRTPWTKEEDLKLVKYKFVQIKN